MDIADFARAVFALVLTLGLVGLGAVALRRFGPDALGPRLAAPRRTAAWRWWRAWCSIPARRLVIVSCDGQERLLLLGEGQLVLGDRRAAGSERRKGTRLMRELFKAIRTLPAAEWRRARGPGRC